MRTILSYWHQLSLKFRTLAGFLTIFVLTALFLVISNLQLQQLNSNTQLMFTNQQIHAELQYIENTHLEWLVDLDRYLLDKGKSNLGIQLDPKLCALGKWLINPDNRIFSIRGSRNLLDKLIPLHETLHESAVQIRDLVSSVNSINNEQALSIYNERTVPTLIQIRELLKQLTQLADQQLVSVEVITEKVDAFRKTLFVYSLITLFFILLLGIQVYRVFRVFKQEVLDVVELSLEELTTYSSEIKANSNQMADGANQQAAGVEETSSSLEEMNSSTKQNVMRVSVIEEVMKELNEVMDQTQETLMQLVNTMSEIKVAGAETKRINKSIEEIAFQTNLLALNAAVEAARAGQAGAGFAVVADEVRALAMRSSESAKSTEVIIDSVYGKIEQGSRLITDTDSRFNTIGSKFKDVDVMLSELTVSMNEQSSGIEQITLAVHEIDRITQSNAAGAEEHAATSDQIYSLAVAIQQRLKEIKALINGN